MADQDESEDEEILRLAAELGRAADARDEKKLAELGKEAKKKGLYRLP